MTANDALTATRRRFAKFVDAQQASPVGHGSKTPKTSCPGCGKTSEDSAVVHLCSEGRVSKWQCMACGAEWMQIED